LTRTVPTPGTLLALIVTAAADALAGALLLGAAAGAEEEAVAGAEEEAVADAEEVAPAGAKVEDDDEHAAAVVAAPRARPIGISLRPDRCWRLLTEIFTETRSLCGPCRIST
jgi:hypothetical protein